MSVSSFDEYAQEGNTTCRGLWKEKGQYNLCMSLKQKSADFIICH